MDLAARCMQRSGSVDLYMAGARRNESPVVFGRGDTRTSNGPPWLIGGRTSHLHLRGAHYCRAEDAPNNLDNFIPMTDP